LVDAIFDRCSLTLLVRAIARASEHRGRTSSGRQSDNEQNRSVLVSSMSLFVQGVPRTNIDRTAMGCENPSSGQAVNQVQPLNEAPEIGEYLVQGLSHITAV
jgi:hypothetical protein